MIAGIFHQGSGMGDQLMRYLTVRTLAEDKGYRWGMKNPDQFKGTSFMDLDLGIPLTSYLEGLNAPTWVEKGVYEVGVDVRSYDPEINFVPDNSLIDGGFEDEKYWGHRIDEIREWLKVSPLNLPDDLCVVGFRGGEYATVPKLFLTKDYWIEAVARMRQKHPSVHFEVHTDDPHTAHDTLKDILPLETPYLHNIGTNWRSVRYAKHLIIPNSAFFIIPSLIGEAEEVIAPRGWARRNYKMWARPACFYKDKRFLYI